MVEFFITNNGGDIVNPEDATPQDSGLKKEISESIADLNRSGFYFYYHPAQGTVRSIFKGTRNVRNQYYGVVEGLDSTNLLDDFKSLVHEAFDRHDWQVTESGHGADTIFTELTSAPAVDELAIRSDLLRNLAPDTETDRPVELGAPDHRSALQVCKRVIEDLGSDTRVAICGSGVIEGLPRTDVVVIPGDSEQPGAPVRETKDRVDEETLEETINDAKQATEELLSGPSNDSGSHPPDPSKAAATIQKAVSDQFDVVIDTETRLSRRLDWLQRRWQVIGGVSGVILGMLIGVWLGILGTALGALTQTVSIVQWSLLEVEFLPAELQVRSWFILAASIMALGATTLRPRKLPFSRWQVTSRGDPRKETGSGKVEASKLVDRLDQISQSSVVDEDPHDGFVSVVRDRVFDDTELNVYSADEIQKNEFRNRAKGFGLGLGFALVLASIIGLVTVAITEFWILFLNAFLALGVLAIAWQTGGILWLVVQQLRSTMQRIRGTSSTVSSSAIDLRSVGRPVLVFAATLAAVDLGAAVWQDGDGFTHYIATMIATETIGRTGLSPQESLGILFFTLFAFVFTGLLSEVRASDTSHQSGAILFGLSAGVTYLWLGPALVARSEITAAAGVLAGSFAAAVLLYWTHHGMVWQTTNWMLGALAVFILVEGVLAYQSPIYYDTEVKATVLRSFRFYGVEPSSLFSALKFVLVVSAVSMVAWSGSLSRRNTGEDVLVLGPRNSNAVGFLADLYQEVQGRQDDQTVCSASENLQYYVDADDPELSKQVSESTILDVSFQVTDSDGTEFTVSTLYPVSDTEILGNAFTRAVQFTKEGASLDQINSNNRVKEEILKEAASEFEAADTVVLLFPVTGVQHGMPGRTESSHSRGQATDDYWYLQTYRELLEDHFGPEQNAIGVATKTEPVVNSVPYNKRKQFEERWDEFRKEVTEQALNQPGYEEDKALIRAGLSHRDNSGVLPIVPFIIDVPQKDNIIMGIEAVWNRILEVRAERTGTSRPDPSKRAK